MKLDSVLQYFLDDDGSSDYVKTLLINRIEECLSGSASGCREFNFNVTDVTINCSLRQVTIDDALQPPGAAQTTLSFDEFLLALR